MEGRDVEYMPSFDEDESAVIARRTWRKIIRHGHLDKLGHTEQKSLSAFSFGGSGWFTLKPASTVRPTGSSLSSASHGFGSTRR